MKKFRLSPVSVALTAVAAVSRSTLRICLSSVPGLYLKDKRVRYLIVASILCLMNIAVFVVNMMK